MVAPSKELGYGLCESIRAEKRKQPISYSALWCWGCVTFTGGDPEKRCGATFECPQVLERYKRENDGRAK